MRWLDLQPACRRQIRIRSRLATQVLALRNDPINNRLELLSNSSAGQNLMCIGTCRNNRAAQTCLTDRLQVAQRPRIRLNSDGAEPPEEDLVLLIAQPVDRFQPRRIIGRALGQVYAARLEKRARPIGAR